MDRFGATDGFSATDHDDVAPKVVGIKAKELLSGGPKTVHNSTKVQVDMFEGDIFFDAPEHEADMPSVTEGQPVEIEILRRGGEDLDETRNMQTYTYLSYFGISLKHS